MIKSKWQTYFSGCCHVTGILCSDWLSSLLQKVGGHLQFLNFLIFFQIKLLKITQPYHSSGNFDADSKSVFKIRKFLISVPPFRESLSANQNAGFQSHGSPGGLHSTYKSTQNRLDNSCPVLAVAQLKSKISLTSTWFDLKQMYVWIATKYTADICIYKWTFFIKNVLSWRESSNNMQHTILDQKLIIQLYWIRVIHFSTGSGSDFPTHCVILYDQFFSTILIRYTQLLPGSKAQAKRTDRALHNKVY